MLRKMRNYVIKRPRHSAQVTEGDIRLYKKLCHNRTERMLGGEVGIGNK